MILITLKRRSTKVCIQAAKNQQLSSRKQYQKRAYLIAGRQEQIASPSNFVTSLVVDPDPTWLARALLEPGDCLVR